MVLVATVVLTIFHPGYCFQGCWTIAEGLCTNRDVRAGYDHRGEITEREPTAKECRSSWGEIDERM